MSKGERQCDFRLGRFGLSLSYVNPAKGDWEAVKGCPRVASITICVLPHVLTVLVPLRLAGWFRCEWACRNDCIWMFNLVPALIAWSNWDRARERVDASTQSED